tara:strand:- start:4271 stop:5011 length:741 start_codon:yes stop_codon:yes gene_type:complete
MRVPRIFTDQPLAEGGEVDLGSATARYLVSVLRLGVAAEVILFNGQGGEYRAQLLKVGNKQVVAAINKFLPDTATPPLAITLIIGLSRGDRMDWVVQKAVELGVSSIIPLSSERCEVKLHGDRATKKTRHWQDIARSACEQSGQNRVPPIGMTINFAAALQLTAAWRIILDPYAPTSLVSEMLAHNGSPHSVLAFSGPEGGFTAEEINRAREHHVVPVALGPRTLRTETAPLATLSLLQARWGDWQ